MMTGTAVAIRPTSVSFCIIFLMRPWPRGKQEDEMFSDAHLSSRVYGFTKHKNLEIQKYSRVESEHYIFSSVRAFWTLTFPFSAYILNHFMVWSAERHLFIFHRKYWMRNEWRGKNKGVELHKGNAPVTCGGRFVNNPQTFFFFTHVY